MAKPKGDRAYNDAVRVLCDDVWHARYRRMCRVMGFSKSEHIRTNMDNELMLFEESHPWTGNENDD